MASVYHDDACRQVPECYSRVVDLTDEEIQRFMKAWEEDFGERLSPEEARSELSRLLNFLYAIADAFSNGLGEEE